MSHARHAKPRRVNLRGRHGTALLGVLSVLASILVATPPTTSTAAATSPNIAGRLRTPVDYGSGLWAGTTSPVRRIGDPATADRLIVGDSIVDRCSTDLVAAFATQGETLAVISQPGQNAAGLYALLNAAPVGLTPRVIFAGGTNDVFDPFAAKTPIGNVKTWAATHVADLRLVDTYVGRTATLAHDLRNSGQVNGYLYATGLPVISMVEQLTAAVGRGRATSYYLQDGVHYWTDAATGHGDGCAFYAAAIVAGVGL